MILKNRGLAVQPFKIGPDFIDPTYLTAASGRQCRNLDGFPRPDLMPFFYADSCRSGPPADIAVVEGVMGLYDGLGADGAYSTAWLAHALGLPVILLVDARAAATSVAATALGFASLKPLAPRIAGVIANRASGERHAELIGEALGRFAGIPLIGWMPNVSENSFPSRHLGLVPAAERSDSAGAIENFANALSAHLDVERLISIASKPSGAYAEPTVGPPVAKSDGAPVRVAIADDGAFCFHYRDNWDLLARLGAETAAVSPMSDDALPHGTDLLILPGGYPEEFSHALSSNERFMRSVADFSRSGCIYAECGGMLYLSRGIEYRGEFRGMAGIIPAGVKMTGRLSRFGYVEATANKDNLLMRAGETMRAHEFHYSRMGPEGDAFCVRKASRPDESWADGYVAEGGRLLATYLHANFHAHALFARRMLCRAAAVSSARRLSP
jgi:cobyrinic acid a,c-diamide synthase